MKVFELWIKVPPTTTFASSYYSASFASVYVTPPTKKRITTGLALLLPGLPLKAIRQSASFSLSCSSSGITLSKRYGLCWVQTLGTSEKIRSKQDVAFFLKFLLWKRSDFLPFWYCWMSEMREIYVLSGLRVLSMARKSLISLSLGYLMEKSSTSFSFKQYSTLQVFMIFQMASMLSFLLSWQIRSCSILDTSKISPFSIQLEISQLRVTCFSTAADRLLSSGSLLSASCISSRLSNLTVLFLLVLTSLMNVLMLLANSPNPLYKFFLKNQSSISDSTNSRFSFSLIGSESLNLFSSSVARKAFCLFLISTLLLYTPNSSCSMAEQVQGVSKGVTTSSFLSVMMRIARSSLGQSLGFFMSSSSIFFATLLATSPHTSDSLTYLIWGSTLSDMTVEINPSEMRLTTLLSASLQFSLRFDRLTVDGIFSEKRLRATAQQSRQTSCMFFMRSLESAQASQVMILSGIQLVKQRWYSLKCGPEISSLRIFKFSLVGLMKQTALRCINFSWTSQIFWMRYTSFLYNLDCVQMMEMIPEVSESRISAFISVISAKIVLKQSSAMGRRLQSSAFFFCIRRSELLYIMTHQQQQNNQQIREIRKKRSTLNIRQRERFQGVFRDQLQPDFREAKYQALLADGVPTVFRNYVWTQLIPNYYSITPQLYLQLAEQLRVFQQEPRYNENQKNGERLSRRENDANPETANEGSGKMAKWISIIRQDIPRTFPELLIFHSDQEQGQRLSNILGSFALFRQDVGYIQGLSLIALLFLQQLNTQYRAFTALTTLVTTTALYDFYTFNNSATSKMVQSIMDKLKERDEELHQLLIEMNIDVKIIVIDWIMTLFSRVFQLDSILNIWDLLLAHRMQSYILEELCVVVLLSRKPHLKEEDSSALAKLMKSGKLSFSEQQRIFQLMHQVPFAE